jgi:hypothetical protein
MTNELLIWWTTQADCEAIGEPHDPADWKADEWEKVLASFRWQGSRLYRLDQSLLPGYIKKQYVSRYGRSGRGRLWVSDEFELDGITWDDSKPAAQYASDAAGIVIRASDLPLLNGLAGFVTDTYLNIVRERP